jgi:hypothetical protein
VEKDFAPCARGVKPSSSIMGDDWVWHRFVDDLAAGEVDCAAKDAAARTGAPVVLRIEAAIAGDRTSDDDHPFGDVACFRAADGRLHLTHEVHVRRMLTPLTASADLGALSAFLEELKDHDWTWVSLWIGTMFLLGGEEGWSPTTVARDAIDPWARWFV